MTGHSILKTYKMSLKAAVAVIHEHVVYPEKDFTRNRILSAETTMRYVLELNGKSTRCEATEYSLRHRLHVSSQSYAKAIRKLLPSAFEKMFREFVRLSVQKLKRPHGRRLNLYAIDGSSVRFATNKKYEGCYHKKSDYSDIHLTVLHDIQSGLIVDAVIQPGALYNEVDAARELIQRLDDPKALVVADRGFESWSLIADCQEKGIRYLIRGKNSNSIGGNRQEEFDEDKVFHLYRSQTLKAKSDPCFRFLSTTSRFDRMIEPDGYYEIKTRIARYMLTSGNWETVITNLDRNEYDTSRLMHAYRERWNVETCFRRLKHTVGMLSFHSADPMLVEQEIWASLIIYNFAVMLSLAAESFIRKGYAINFAVAVTTAKETASERASPSDAVEQISRESKKYPVLGLVSQPRHKTVISFVPFLYRAA